MVSHRSISRLRVFNLSWIIVRRSSSSSTKPNTTSVSGKHSAMKADNDDGGYYRDQSPSDSLFKRTFKYYKRRDHSPDLSKVMDLRNPPSNSGVVCSPFIPQQQHQHILQDETLSLLGLRPVSEWTVSTVVKRPGMIMFNGIFNSSKHLKWIKRALLDYAEPPGLTNVGLHYPDTTEIFKNHSKQLRWATVGLHYDWDTKIYPTTGEPLPQELSILADLFSQALGLGPMHADAAIVNYYMRKSSLSPHVDRSERTISLPLISLSFGQSAIYLAGGTTLDDPIDAFYIHSGDALIIYDQQRLIYHGVPRIVQTTKFEEQPGIVPEIVAYANQNRVNITIRQVDGICN